MTPRSANQLPVLITRKRPRPQCHTLIQRHPFANPTRLANYHTGTMINEKCPANLGARMNIDPGFPMSPLSHHSRQIRHPQNLQLMSQTIHTDRLNARITQHDLIPSLCSRILLKCCTHIRH